MIILLFGQPASGKTTLANHFLDKNKFGRFIHIDGDEWRDVTKNKNYTKEGRLMNLKGAFDMALYLERKGYSSILSFVTPYEELRQYLCDNSDEFYQIYLTYSEDRGRNTYFASEFDEPLGSCLHLDTSEMNIDDCCTKIIEYVAKKSTC